jgi:hypothetical protein
MTLGPFKCTPDSSSQKASDFMGGFLHGILGLFGGGSLVDPLGDAKTKLATAQQTVNSQTAALSLAAAEGTVKLEVGIIKFMNVQHKQMVLATQGATSALWDAIATENMFITILGILTMILIFFVLITPRACSAKGFSCGPSLA